MAYCKVHPNAIAVGRCAGCAEEFCQNCLVDIRGEKYCGACKVMALQGKTPEAAIQAQERQGYSNSDATSALVLAIIGLVTSLFCVWIGIACAIGGIQRATVARSKVAADPRLGGGGVAIVAIVIAILAIIVSILNFILGIILRVQR